MKCVALISSGIDSPIACYQLSSCVDSFTLVHADNRPFTDEREIKNTLQLVKKLYEIIQIPITLYFISHGEMLQDIVSIYEKRYTCVLCKRMMVRYADYVCKKECADAIIMGDSLGQVASQTLQNIKVIDEVTSVPIFRPLIGFDKEEIIAISKKIGTYEYSILPSGSCSAVPTKPATKAKMDKIKKIEKENALASKIEELVNKAKILSVSDDIGFSDL